MVIFLLVIISLLAIAQGGYVKDITGYGLTDGVYGMYDADLGIPRWDSSRNATAVMFGDNFEYQYLKGEWRSPSIVMYDSNFNPIGIPTSGNGISKQRVVQLWYYQHNNGQYTTVLPCDFIKIGSVWYVAVMVTAGLGNELRTEFWKSYDLVSWSGPVLVLNHPTHPGNVMLTFDVIGSYVYIFGTGGLNRNKPIWLWRNLVSQFPLGWWEPWGYDGRTWAWGNANENTPVLQGAYGELSFRYIGGKTVLSYFDVTNYKCTALATSYPWDNLYAANSVDFALGRTTSQLYGCYTSGDSVLGVTNGMKFTVSQWITSKNDPYKVMYFTGTLKA